MTGGLELRKKRLTDINGLDILAGEIVERVELSIEETQATKQDVADTTKRSTFKALFYPEDDPEYVKKVLQDVADMVANAEGPTLSAEEMMFTQLSFRDSNRVREESIVREGTGVSAEDDSFKEESYDIKRGVVTIGFKGSGPINHEQLLPNPDLNDSELVDVGRQLIGKYDSIQEMHVIIAGKVPIPEIEKPVEVSQIAQPEPAAVQLTPDTSANPFFTIRPEDIKS